MDKGKFKDLIEAPTTRESLSFLDKICLRGIIQRTVRITLQYPELAQGYLDSLPKAVNENVPTINK
jgi:hypothetical protein